MKVFGSLWDKYRVAIMIASVLAVCAVGISYFTFFSRGILEPHETKIIFFSPDYTLDPRRPTIPSEDLSPLIDLPISYDNFLSYSYKMSEISKELANVCRDILDKKITINSNASSYKGQASMVIITREMIEIPVYRDMASILTKKEILAYAIHEVAHVYLNHKIDGYIAKRDLFLEIEADMWAVSKGINPNDLISTLSKLESGEEERNARIKILNMFKGNQSSD